MPRVTICRCRIDNDGTMLWSTSSRVFWLIHATSRMCGWLTSAPGRLSIENMMWKCMPKVGCTILGEDERLCQYIPEVQTKLSPTELTSLHKGCRRSEAD